MSLAAAGVCAAIMLAACQDGAAQLLAWPNGSVGVAGAIAVRGAQECHKTLLLTAASWQGLAVPCVAKLV